MKKIFNLNFLKRVCFSGLFLWVFLVFLKRFNLKPSIKISFFFFAPVLLLLTIYLRQVLTFLIIFLNKINIFLKTTDEKLEIRSKKLLNLFSIFLKNIFEFLRGFPKFLKFVLRSHLFWLGICAFGIFLDVFVFKFTSDFLILALTGLWILSLRHYKFEGRVSVAIALGFLILCPFLLIFKKDFIAEKAAIWAYMFLLVGTIQLFIEYMVSSKPK